MFKRRAPSKTLPPSDAPVESVIETALSWEASRIHLIEQSEQRAWRVAIVAVICVVLLAIAIALMLPLKQNTPYVIRVDNTTGVPDIITALDYSQQTACLLVVGVYVGLDSLLAFSVIRRPKFFIMHGITFRLVVDPFTSIRV